MVDILYDYKPMPYVGQEACREAVLKPILKGIKKEKALKRPLDGQHALLQQLWRMRVLKLGEHNWERARPGKGLQYMRNCPPFGVQYGHYDKIHSCGVARVCPNCFARLTVYPAYRAAEWLFYLHNNKPVTRYDLVVVRQDWTRDVTLAEAFELIRGHRAMYRKQFKSAAGAVVVSTVEPARTGWKIQMGTVVAADEQDLPDLGTAEVQRLGSDHMTKRRLARMVGWACRYPLGMMYGGEAKAAQLLTEAARYKVHQYVSTGAMRNSKNREMNYR